MHLLSAVFVQIASIIGGGINGALGIMVNLITSGFKAATQFHQEGIAFAREVGLNAREAQAYTQALTERTSDLALKYGVTADAIKEVQRNIVDATGKQYMLNKAEAERQVQINKLVGAGTAKIFTEQMMNHMGGQLSAVQGAISKAYVTASKNGLNAAKFSEKVAQNLTLANKLSFRNGVDGIIKMTALSEKLGFNLQSVAAATDKFMELDNAIASSAQLQMLGGAAGAYGSNPLTMSYEANYDPEAFTERMTNMLGGYAQFNTKTGVADVNGMNRDFVKNIASAMGISMDEAMSIAKKQAEVKYKEGAFGRELGRISPENRDAVLNRSYVDAKTGHLMINDVSGQQHDITKNGLDESILAELQKFDNMSEKEIMEKQAQELTDINAQLKGVGASFAASLATYLNKQLPGLTKSIREFATQLLPKVKDLGESLGKSLDEIITIARDYKDTFASIAKGVLAVGKFLSDHWGIALAAWLGWKMLGMKIGGPATTLGGKLGGKALGGLKSIGGKAAKGFWNIATKTAKGAWSGIKMGAKGFWNIATKAAKGAWSGIKMGAKGAWNLGKKVGSKTYDILGKGGANHSWKQAKNYAKNAYRMSNGNTFTKGLHGAKSLWKNSKALRASVKGGAAILGVAGNMATDYLVDKGKIKKGGAVHYGAKMASTAAEYGALGATIGSIIPGLGTGVGATIGGAVGAIKGAYDTWKSLPENADKDFIDYSKTCVKGMWEGMKSVGSAIGDAASSVFSSLGETMKERGGILKSIGNLIIAPIRGFITFFESLVHPIDTIKSIWQKIQNFFNADYKGKWQMIKNGVADMMFGSREKHAEGGIVGGNSYSGDKILAGLNSGEMVLNKGQQAQLFNLIGSATSILTNVVSKPFGENSFRKIPKSDYTEYSYRKGGDIGIKDINLNVSGTIKLDVGNNSKNLDINSLLNDTSFISSLKDMIKQSINNDINNGRFMNDVSSTLRGMPSQVGVWGKK